MNDMEMSAQLVEQISMLEAATGEKVPDYVFDTLYEADRLDIVDERLPDEIYEFLEFVDNIEIYKPRGRKPLNPEGAMSGAERNRRYWKNKRREIHEDVDPYRVSVKSYENTDVGEYEAFVDALRLFEQGEDVNIGLPKWNRYLSALYKTATGPRSVRSLCNRGDIHSSRLSKLMGMYGIFDKDENRNRATYTASEKGVEFLVALYPGLKRVIEKDSILDSYMEQYNQIVV